MSRRAAAAVGFSAFATTVVSCNDRPRSLRAATSTDVLIVGGGFSGAVVARELKTAGLSCAVLEARDRIGGRTFTTQVPPSLASALD